MAKRTKNGKLAGNISKRVQARNPVTGRWVKIDTTTGRILAHKKSRGPWKNVRRVRG